jgi:hypothetical protein
MGGIDWKKIHRFEEKRGWCGPATIQMILAAAGIEKPQEEIAKFVDLDWWGTTQNITVAYLSKFFDNLGFEQDASVKDIENHLKKGHLVIVDWWDNLDEGKPEGHYSLAGGIDREKKTITLVDPYPQRKGIWEMSIREFEDRWFDTLDVRDRIRINSFLIWVDPSSVAKKS